MLGATRHLEPLLTKSRKTVGEDSDIGRLAPQLFLSESDPGVTMTPGHLNLSPGWYQRGHDVRNSDDLSLSGLTRRQWLEAIQETNEIVAAILYVIHPELHRAGMSAMESLRKVVDDPTVIDTWSSPFNGVSVIVNRETPDHRDFHGRGDWYDILASIGTYPELYLELTTLGVKVDYPPGTVVPLLGKLLVHRVPRSLPDRVCYAWWFRDNVHRNMGSVLTRWACRKDVASGYDGAQYVTVPT
ncbi:hypothetical protein DENSPDRAFT_789032 [Dentipellis sp. KUC8613]|nr:hypothetical protein DENSPDRAFT_789032 [Dentipellis sp. KUC8613]